MASQKEVIRIFADAQNEVVLLVQEYTQQLGAVIDAKMCDESTQQSSRDAFLDPVISMTALWKSALSDAMTLAQSTKEIVATARKESTDQKATEADTSAMPTQANEKNAIKIPNRP